MTFADQNITRARELAARPIAGQQAELVDTVRAAESALGQARSLLDAVDSAESDINRAVAGCCRRRSPTFRTASPRPMHSYGRATYRTPTSSPRPATPRSRPSTPPRPAARPTRSGAFTQLTKADAELDRLLAGVAAGTRSHRTLAAAFDQALFTAQSRVRAVSDYIDTRRGSIGPEARTRLSEAVRQLRGRAGQAGRPSSNEAIAYANGASMLAAQAQSLANADVQAAQRATPGSTAAAAPNMGAVIGGIIIGNILQRRDARRDGRFGGGWSSTGFGGSSSSGGGFFGGGGRF